MRKQQQKDLKNLYFVFAGFDTSYDQFNELCREAWKDEGCTSLNVDWHKRINQVSIGIEKKIKRSLWSVYQDIFFSGNM